jgi:hypothetical protein
MKRYLPVLFVLALLSVWGTFASSQMTDTCADGKVLVMNLTNKRYKCMAASLPLVYRATGLNVNQTNTDIGSYTTLPAKYIVRRFTVDNCSATPTSSTVSLRTAIGGGGTAIVNAAALATLTATTTFLDTSLAVTTATQSTATLTIRSVAAAGGAATCDFTLEITPLN